MEFMHEYYSSTPLEIYNHPVYSKVVQYAQKQYA